MDSWERLACYPQGSFYPLSDGPSTRNHRITKPYFLTCSSCLTRSQAHFCLYTLCADSVRAEGTFGRLRYILGGDRPSQTAADIEVPNLPVDMDSWERLACYPQGSFYPLSDGPSTRNHRITKPYFLTCSSCLTRSQAHFCLYTLCADSVRAEGTFGRLRYILGGDRPSQTARLILS